MLMGSFLIELFSLPQLRHCIFVRSHYTPSQLSCDDRVRPGTEVGLKSVSAALNYNKDHINCITNALLKRIVFSPNLKGLCPRGYSGRFCLSMSPNLDPVLEEFTPFY